MFRQDFQMPLQSFPDGNETEEIRGFREGHGARSRDAPASYSKGFIPKAFSLFIYSTYCNAGTVVVKNTRQMVSIGRKNPAI